MTKLLGSIYFGRDDIMASAVDHGRVRPHQGHRDSTEKLACWLSFVTTLLSGKSLPKSPHHIRCHTMKAPESFYCQRRKLKPLGSTRFCSISHFPVIGLGQSPARFCCCACHIGWGERAGNGDIYSHIFIFTIRQTLLNKNISKHKLSDYQRKGSGLRAAERAGAQLSLESL